ncbi:MAG: hypothetical protein L6Q76_08700, partial [Polyangiaceae bacterium]|nr:hypothetical protein [Polyangiaceae bacterium]
MLRDIQRGEVDIVVFPEMHENAQINDAEAVVRAEAQALGCPVLMGIWADNAYQTAFYCNPKPSQGDTARHSYFKHATSLRLAYEWPGYKANREAMFSPIRLRGETLGVQLCHDIFFGLISNKLRSEGASILLDLTGSNVNRTKWKNVIRGRSIEHRCLVLCTMSHWPDRGGIATAFAYRGGQEITPAIDRLDDGPRGGYAVFDTEQAPSLSDDATAEQAFTEKAYAAIRIRLGAADRRSCDVAVYLEQGQLLAVGARPLRSAVAAGWTGYQTSAGSLGLLLLPGQALYDPLAITRAEPRPPRFEQHIVVYGNVNASESHDEIVALLRLRA